MDDLVEPAEARGQPLDGRVVTTRQGLRQLMEQVEFAEQPRTHEQMRIGSLESGMRVGLHDPVDDLWRGLVDDGREVLGRIRDLGMLPTDDAAHPAAGGIVIVEGDQERIAAQRSVDERGRETPQRHVLQGLLPAGEQGGRNAARRRRPVQIGQPARPAGIGVVTGQTGLVGECDIEVVDSGHDPPDVTRQTAPIRHLTQIDRVAGEERIDRCSAGVAEIEEALRAGDREAHAPRQEGRDGDRRLQFGTGGCGARCPDHPPSVFGVPDEGDVEPVVGQAGQGLDGHRVQARHGRAGHGGEVEGAAVHLPTVCRGCHLEWVTWPEETEPMRIGALTSGRGRHSRSPVPASTGRRSDGRRSVCSTISCTTLRPECSPSGKAASGSATREHWS